MLAAWRVRRRPWQAVAYWALDLELTGLDLDRDHIVSVGMVPVRDGRIRLGERCQTRVRTDRHSTNGALLVHGIAPDEVRDAPALATVLGEVTQRLAGAVLVVHHAPVDVRFLRRACRAADVPWPAPPVVDTAALTRRLARRAEMVGAAVPEPADLASIRAHLDLPPHRAHRALDDALATAELFLALAARLGARRVGDLM